MDDIILEQTYAYPIKYVWEAPTDPDSLDDWLMPGDLKPVVGRKVTFHCELGPEFDGPSRCRSLKRRNLGAFPTPEKPAT